MLGEPSGVARTCYEIRDVGSKGRELLGRILLFERVKHDLSGEFQGTLVFIADAIAGGVFFQGATKVVRTIDENPATLGIIRVQANSLEAGLDFLVRFAYFGATIHLVDTFADLFAEEGIVERDRLEFAIGKHFVHHFAEGFVEGWATTTGVG